MPGRQDSQDPLHHLDLDLHRTWKTDTDVRLAPDGNGGVEWVVGGTDGKSAYDVAVEGGFVGDEAAWLASLVGPTGATGATGPTGATGATGATGPAGPVDDWMIWAGMVGV